METAICSVVVLGFSGMGVAGWFMYKRVCMTLQEAVEARATSHVAASIAQDCRDLLGDIRGVLSEASVINRAKQKSSVFDGDKIQEKPAQRYVPIARRRAQAEQSSMGPQNHAESVREANARAIESAG